MGVAAQVVPESMDAVTTAKAVTAPPGSAGNVASSGSAAVNVGVGGGGGGGGVLSSSGGGGAGVAAIAGGDVPQSFAELMNKWRVDAKTRVDAILQSVQVQPDEVVWGRALGLVVTS